MPRRPRIHIPGAFYHVTLRGNHRGAIFYSIDDRRLLGRIVATTLRHFPARVHAYCWMSNHIHLLIQAGDMPLGRVIHRVASRYARVVQTRLATTGHLFERRYHAVLVDADAYLLTLVRYIHLNPVRAGVVERIGDYPWSSHHDYIGTRSQPWVTTDFTLAMFAAHRPRAVARYRAFVEEQDSATSASPLEQTNPRDPRVLGGDDFLHEIPVEVWRSGTECDLAALIEQACRTHGVHVEDLRSDSRQRRLTRVRAWIGHQAVTQRIASLSEVARSLHRSESALRESVLRHHPPDPR